MGLGLFEAHFIDNHHVFVRINQKKHRNSIIFGDLGLEMNAVYSLTLSVNKENPLSLSAFSH